MPTAVGRTSWAAFDLFYCLPFSSHIWLFDVAVSNIEANNSPGCPEELAVCVLRFTGGGRPCQLFFFLLLFLLRSCYHLGALLPFSKWFLLVLRGFSGFQKVDPILRGRGRAGEVPAALRASADLFCWKSHVGGDRDPGGWPDFLISWTSYIFWGNWEDNFSGNTASLDLLSANPLRNRVCLFDGFKGGIPSAFPSWWS